MDPLLQNPSNKSQKQEEEVIGKKTTKEKNWKKFACTVLSCSYSTPYRKDLVRHMRKHTGEKPFSCDACSKVFSRYDKLLQHTRAHEGIRPFKCTEPSCTFSCNDATGLKKHCNRVHSDQKPYPCQLCSYRAKDSNQLNIHLRFHTGDSPYACILCTSAFKTSTDLQRHNRVHTREKPFVCPHCTYRSALKCNLTTHIRRKHPSVILKAGSIVPTQSQQKTKQIQPKQPALPYKIACKFCNYETESMKSVKLHLLRKHKTNEFDSIFEEFKKERKESIKRDEEKGFAKRFQCTDPGCSAKFVSEKSLRCHIRQHVSLHPPPQPSLEVIVSSLPSREHGDNILSNSDSNPAQADNGSEWIVVVSNEETQ